MFAILNYYYVMCFRSDFNIAVLKAFVNLHEFSDMILVQALRFVSVVIIHFCKGFRDTVLFAFKI
jgi:hypothetical protein